MLELESKGYPVIMSVHDEIVCDTPKEFGNLEDFISIMEKKPEWAKGLPLKVEAWEGPIYKK